MIFKRSIKQFFRGDPRLKGYWSFDGSFTDYSGNGNNGANFNVSFVPTYDKFRGGLAVYFNGSTSYVWLGDPSSLSPPRPLSLLLWIKTSATTWPQYGSVFIRKRLGGWNLGIGDNGTGRIQWGFWNGTTQIVVFSTKLVNDNKWHLIVGVIGTNYVSLYIDGRLESSLNNSDSIAYGAGGVAFGRDGDNSGNYYNGLIDEAGFFSRALSPTEISAYYKWVVSPKKYFVFTEPSINTRRRLLLSM
jgi:hypothetical protein